VSWTLYWMKYFLFAGKIRVNGREFAVWDMNVESEKSLKNDLHKR
jgi:hypothetical protein